MALTGELIGAGDPPLVPPSSRISFREEDGEPVMLADGARVRGDAVVRTTATGLARLVLAIASSALRGEPPRNDPPSAP